MEDKISEYRLLAEFMGFPKVVVGSVWNYDRSLDNSPQTKNLVVIEVQNCNVRFEQRMAYLYYGISFFDGRVFSPDGKFDISPVSNFSSFDIQLKIWHKIFEYPLPLSRAMEITDMDFFFMKYVRELNSAESLKVILQALNIINGEQTYTSG